MSDIESIKADYKVLTARVDGLQNDFNDKHQQNRRSIHELRDGQQTMIDALHGLEIKFARAAGWAVGAGTIVGVALHFIDRIPVK